MQQNYEIFKDLIQTVWFTLLVLLFVLEKKSLKMTSQLVIFRIFFSSLQP